VRFDATLASFTLKPRRQPVSLVDPKPRPSAPRLSFVALQHSKTQEPFFSLLAERPGRVALRPRKSHPQGLATLSGASALEPLGASLSPRHSWAPPFKALLLHSDRKNLSAPPLRPCAFSRNLLGLGPALRRLDPTMEAVPLFATGWIRSGRGPCSPGPTGLSGSPSVFRIQRASLPPDGLPDVGSSHPSRDGIASSSRPCQKNGPAFSLTGRRPVWPFRRPALASSSNEWPPADYFFLSKHPCLLRSPSTFS